MKKITPDPPDCGDQSKLEDTLLRASELLRCAGATAYEAGDHLSGTHRDLVFAVMHLVEMAKTMVDRSLESVEAR